MFEQLFERLPDLALATPGPLPRRTPNFISGLESMPVTFTPARPDRFRPLNGSLAGGRRLAAAV